MKILGMISESNELVGWLVGWSLVHDLCQSDSQSVSVCALGDYILTTLVIITTIVGYLLE